MPDNVTTANIRHNERYVEVVGQMVGERIKEIREKNGLTQSSLAKKLNISRSAVNAWEMGVSIPSAQYLIELCRLFKVSVDYLLELDRAERVDISFLSEEEKKMLYSLLNYFKKYGDTVRDITRQTEEDYDIIRQAAEDHGEPAVKNILERLLSIAELFE